MAPDLFIESYCTHLSVEVPTSVGRLELFDLYLQIPCHLPIGSHVQTGRSQYSRAQNLESL